jgi:hypothetical protein
MKYRRMGRLGKMRKMSTILAGKPEERELLE